MPRSAKGDLILARGDFDACTASLFLYALHVPQSCTHRISPCGMVLSADRQGSLFFTQALQTLPLCAAVPASSCMHMPPDPMPSSTPWGEGEQIKE